MTPLSLTQTWWDGNPTGHRLQIGLRSVPAPRRPGSGMRPSTSAIVLNALLRVLEIKEKR